MTVEAVKCIRQLHGCSRPQLMLCDDGYLYVVKSFSNSEHRRVLANEILTSLLAKWMGLPVAEYGLIYIPPHINELLSSDHRPANKMIRSSNNAIHFGSRLVGSLRNGLVTEYLPSSLLEHVQNIDQFAGMLALDKWIGNTGRRKAIFFKMPDEPYYTATFIDHANCFGAGNWQFVDAESKGAFSQIDVYNSVTGWENFEPTLSKLMTMDPQTAWRFTQQIPPEWYERDAQSLDYLTSQLLIRRSSVRRYIALFRDSARKPFTKWGGRREALVWSARARRSSIDHQPLTPLNQCLTAR